MKEEYQSKIEVSEKEIRSAETTQEKTRRKVYKWLLAIYILCGVLIFFIEDEDVRRYSLFLLPTLSLIFGFIYPKPAPIFKLVVNKVRLSIEPSSFWMKSSFDFNEVKEVRVIGSEGKYLVTINYGIMQNRHDLVEGLNKEDAKRVKEWLEEKIKRET